MKWNYLRNSIFFYNFVSGKGNKEYGQQNF